MRWIAVSVVVAVAFAVGSSPAGAAVPTFASLTAQDRHPAATLYVPKADRVTIYFATKPDRATDGTFLSENVAYSYYLTDGEIQVGRWLSSERIAPGTYYVLMNASLDYSACVTSPPPDYNSVSDPTCADGWSEMRTLTIPAPPIRFSASFSPGYLASFTLRMSPAPRNTRYTLCSTSLRKSCLRGVISGYSWDSASSDTLYLSTSDFKKGTKTAVLRWRVASKVVASRSVRVRK
jgi:hypothetical protein